MKIRRFTKFAFVVVIAALIVGVPPWDQIQRSATPQIEDLHREIPIGVVLPLTSRTRRSVMVCQCSVALSSLAKRLITQGNSVMQKLHSSPRTIGVPLRTLSKPIIN